VEIDLSY